MTTEYDQEFRDTGIPDRAKEWVDARVQNAGATIYGGGLAVLSSGFGKGVLITAAIATFGIVTMAVAAPAMVFAPEVLAAGVTLAQSITTGLTVAGNFLLGYTGGIALLATGGAIGSLAEAHTENTRISKEAAITQAALYAKLRESESKASTLEKEFCNDVPGGNCAKLLHKQQTEQRGHAI